MQDYAKAILAGATNNGLAPTSSPIVTDPARLAAISGANASKFAANLTGASANALQGTAGNQADLNMNAIKGQIQQSQAREAEAKRMADPNNYRQVPNDHGGFDFKDPNGNPITVDQYSKVTGQPKALILKHSTDPTDVAFKNDYNNLQDLLEATLNKDHAKLDEYYKNQPELRSMQPQDLLNRFKAYYPGYFTSDSNTPRTQSAWGPAYTSLPAAAGNNAYTGGGQAFN